MTAPIRIVLADDQQMVRGALAALLEMNEDIEVVAQAGTGAQALAAVREHRPDVTLIDIEMPDGDGLSVASQLRDFPTKVLILTTFGRPGYLRRAMEAQASGFVVKDAPADQLVDAVRRVVAGERVLDSALAAATLSTGDNPLTPREQDVLRAARTGSSAAVIASALFLSEGTVRNYLSSAIGKTGGQNRMEAVHTADLHGWL